MSGPRPLSPCPAIVIDEVAEASVTPSEPRPRPSSPLLRRLGSVNLRRVESVPSSPAPRRAISPLLLLRIPTADEAEDSRAAAMVRHTLRRQSKSLDNLLGSSVGEQQQDDATSTTAAKRPTVLWASIEEGRVQCDDGARTSAASSAASSNNNNNNNNTLQATSSRAGTLV